MQVQCDECCLEYDDVYRLTFCPHDEFPMRTVATNGTETKVCTTLEELDEFFARADRVADAIDRRWPPGVDSPHG